MRHRSLRSSIVVAVLIASTSCVSLDYDLAQLSIPISAKPAEPGSGEVERFEIEARNVLWLHGLFGHSQPDVAQLLTERCEGFDRVADLRVRQTSNVHQWLVTHLSLTIVRMRTVVIEGELVRDSSP